MPIKEAPPTLPRQPVMSFGQWINLAVVILVLLAVWMVFQEQKNGKERGYQNRAVTCDMIKGLGLTESPECRSDGVEQYRSKEASASSTAGAKNSRATMVVVCQVAHELKLSLPECAGIG